MGSFRTTLALSVVFVHIAAGGLLVGGRNAVQMFYCVSGFLITYVLTRRHSYSTKRSFYFNRALRIYPIYFFIAAISLIVKVCSDTSFTQAFAVMPFSGKLFLGLSNCIVFGQDWVMFLALRAGTVHFSAYPQISDYPLWRGLLVPQAWTLGVELSFYALAPFIVTRVWRIWVALSISVVARAILIFMGFALRDPWSYRFFPSEMMWFMLGALSMRILLPRCQNLLNDKPRWAAFCVVLVLALLVLYPVMPGPGPAKSVALIVLIAVLLPAMFVFQNHSSFDRHIGELSYPIYISHQLVAILTASALARFSIHQGKLLIVVQVAVVIVTAYGLNLLIATPIEKLRVRIRKASMA